MSYALSRFSVRKQKASAISAEVTFTRWCTSFCRFPATCAFLGRPLYRRLLEMFCGATFFVALFALTLPVFHNKVNGFSKQIGKNRPLRK